MDDIQVPQSETQYPLPFASSPLFPLLYLSLLTQRHAPNTKTLFRKTYDYIVVGAGSAGSTLAARLSEESCISVLLLEAGNSPPKMTDIPVISEAFTNSDIDWNYLTAPQEFTGHLLQNQQLTFPLGKVVGGTSILNGMIYIRGHRHIFDEWAANGAEGWSYSDLLPYFMKMENHEDPEVTDFQFHGHNGPITVEKPSFESCYKSALKSAIYERGYYITDINGQYQRGFYDFQLTTRNAQRCSVAKAYLVPAENRTNLDIVEKAFVTKVVIKGKQAIGVYVDIKGGRHFIRARREVIISAGTIKTPQLLMLSGIGPRSHLEEIGITVIEDLPVGLNLQDHVASFHVYYSDKLPSAPSVLNDSRTIMQYIEERTGPLVTPGGLQTIAFLTNDRYALPDAIPDYQLYFFNGASEGMATRYNLVPEAYQAIYEPYENKSQLWCMSQNLKPRSRGFVKLHSSDPYDDPVIDPRYFADEKDVWDIVEGLKECDRIAGTNAMRKLELKSIETFPNCKMHDRFSDDYLECEVRSVTFTTSHMIGTAKMGNSSDLTTVVDPLLRVKGIEGLRVVDASVMPMVPTGNTNVPVITIAEKAADIIKGTISCNCKSFDSR